MLPMIRGPPGARFGCLRFVCVRRVARSPVRSPLSPAASPPVRSFVHTFASPSARSFPVRSPVRSSVRVSLLPFVRSLIRSFGRLPACRSAHSSLRLFAPPFRPPVCCSVCPLVPPVRSPVRQTAYPSVPPVRSPARPFIVSPALPCVHQSFRWFVRTFVHPPVCSPVSTSVGPAVRVSACFRTRQCGLSTRPPYPSG